MDGDAAASDRARQAARRSDWREVHDLLRAVDEADLDPGDLELLADAAWWLSRVEESLAVRHRACTAFQAAGDRRRAAYNAWILSTEYGLIGRPALSAGWLTKARRFLADEPDCAEQGFVTYAVAEQAEARGDLDEAARLAADVVAIGERCGDADVVAMGRQLEARLLVAHGEVAAGIAVLDEVMSDVVAGALTELTTGWLYCLAVPICFEVADLRRAGEWNDAAMQWCATLPFHTPFHGLCRVHHVELLGLNGAWEQARAEAERACTELLAYHPAVAAESFYVAGELHRRRGDLAGAEAAFHRASELGREPQPGLALVRLVQGRPEAAAAALRSCLAGGEWGPLGRARLLAAQVEVALAAGYHDEAAAAAAALSAEAEGSGTLLFEALAATAEGTLALEEGDVAAALERLRRARGLWLELELPYEAADTRVRLANASRAAGDGDTADLELRAARTFFERLGADTDVRRVDDLLGGGTERGAGGLTPRQLEVLRLIAAGRSNRAIAAELVISEHTVARHIDNIYTRLGVSSRAAAASYAHMHHLV